MSEAVTSDFLHDRPVEVHFGAKEKLGFLMMRVGPVSAPAYTAHYVDGVVESINPPGGFPRPTPDPAVRSKGVVIPASLRTGTPESYSHGSRYTGQMRRVVQCAFSRGLESKFSYSWQKSHGILEFPRPRIVGSSVNQENVNAALRRFWLIEISTQGVFAAPLKMGTQCVNCATNLGSYLPTSAQITANPGWAPYAAEVSLAWAFANANAGGAIQRLLDAGGIAAPYSAGTPWYGGMGWAFSYSGFEAANVVSTVVTAPQNYYDTKLFSCAFSVAFSGQNCSISIVSPGVAELTLAGHGIPENGLAVVSGADQPEYNGAHVATAVTVNTFRFNVQGSPSSPATGTVKVANGAGDATLTAAVSMVSSGRVTFRSGDHSGGTLWVPDPSSIALWGGIAPIIQKVADTGPVHVFYDEETRIVTNWGNAPEQVPLLETPSIETDQGTISWGGDSSGNFAYTLPGPIIDGICQSDSCTLPTVTYIVGGAGAQYQSYVRETFGFSGPFNQIVITSDPQSKIDVVTTQTDEHDGPHHQQGYSYSMCPDCWYTDSHGALQRTGSVVIEYWSTLVVMQTTITHSTETQTGLSTLILFPTEREAVAGARIQKTLITGTVDYQNSLAATREHVIKISPPEVPFTNVNRAWPSGTEGAQPPAAPSQTSFSTPTISNAFNLRASGGISVAETWSGETTPAYIEPFLRYSFGVKETAESGIFMMRGGLIYTDPTLQPPPSNQQTNHVKDLAALSVGGGFSQLSGKIIEAFIGQV